MIFVLIFLYIITLLIMTVKNTLRIWCSWCSIADFSSARTGSSPVIRYLDVYSVGFRKMVSRIMIWLLIMVLGGAIIYFSANLVEMFWRSRRADEKLWWTRQMWALIWFCWIVIWWLVLFWIVSFADPTNMNNMGY